MPPKKAAGTAAPKKSASAAPAHASYKDMIKNAILNLKERNGSSRQAIKKYIKANNNLGATTDTQFSSQINRALAAGEANGEFARPKGASGPVKLAKKDAAKAKETKTKTAAKKAATKAAPKEKKAAAPKKTTTTTTKTATKKAAPKDKANAGRPRKTAAAKSAPAIDEKPAVVTGKTKSGRVTKTKAPIAAAKKAAPKKAPMRKAAPKKSTPKKADAAAA